MQLDPKSDFYAQVSTPCVAASEDISRPWYQTATATDDNTS